MKCLTTLLSLIILVFFYFDIVLATNPKKTSAQLQKEIDETTGKVMSNPLDIALSNKLNQLIVEHANAMAVETVAKTEQQTKEALKKQNELGQLGLQRVEKDLKQTQKNLELEREQRQLKEKEQVQRTINDKGLKDQAAQKKALELDVQKTQAAQKKALELDAQKTQATLEIEEKQKIEETRARRAAQEKLTGERARKVVVDAGKTQAALAEQKHEANMAQKTQEIQKLRAQVEQDQVTREAQREEITKQQEEEQAKQEKEHKEQIEQALQQTKGTSRTRNTETTQDIKSTDVAKKCYEEVIAEFGAIKFSLPIVDLAKLKRLISNLSTTWTDPKFVSVLSLFENFINKEIKALEEASEPSGNQVELNKAFNEALKRANELFTSLFTKNGNFDFKADISLFIKIPTHIVTQDAANAAQASSMEKLKLIRESLVEIDTKDEMKLGGGGEKQT